jgi:hypothetical protein
MRCRCSSKQDNSGLGPGAEREGSGSQEGRRRSGFSTCGGGKQQRGHVEAANELLVASKMRVDSLPIAAAIRPSAKAQKKLRQPSPSKLDAPATNVEEASTQVSCDDALGPRKSPFKL